MRVLVLVYFFLHYVAGQRVVTDYAPRVNTQCPDQTKTPLLRAFTPQTQAIHSSEDEYIKSREGSAIPSAWESWLGADSELGYRASEFKGKYPRVGMAFSGGGYRAAQYGAGVLNALDARNPQSKSAGTGGLLQVSSYIAGLSGGSWLLGSLALHDWPQVPDVVFGNGQGLPGWLLDLPLLTPDGPNIFSGENQAFFGSVLSSVVAKAQTGIDTSITDLWSRAVSYHFLNETSRENFFTNDSAHGAGQLWSGIPHTTSFQQHSAPFPIVLFNSRPADHNNSADIPLHAPVYEATPFEFGSFDPSLSAMTDIAFTGTKLNNGKPDNDSACVTGFDQAGFILGTSSSLFNALLDDGINTVKGLSTADATGLLHILRRELQAVQSRADDVANWPSPFTGLNPDTFIDSKATWLELVDGGLNEEVVPFGPLMVKSRQVDVIIGIDTDRNDPVNSWPEGVSPITSAKRISTLLNATHQAFPPIPGTKDEFLSTGVNRRPTFFGCDPSNSPPEYPLIIYLPNSPPLNGQDPVTNTDTFKLAYTLKHTQKFLDQAFANTVGGFKPNTNDPDPNWSKCLKCAAVDRARYKSTPVVPRSEICQACFKQYCFDPQNPPSQDALPNRKFAFVDPDPQGLDKFKTFAAQNRPALIGGVAGVVGLIAIFVGVLCFRRRRKEARYKKLKEVKDDAAWNGRGSIELTSRR